MTTNIIFDSARFSVCNLCCEVIYPDTPVVVEGAGLLSGIPDLFVMHTTCYQARDL